MTGPSETEKLRRQLDEARQQSACARRHAASLAAKNAKQRNEIGRLTREVEQLRSDKSNLLFEINKMRAAERQRREMQTEARADHG
ncbi:hypothetical protein LV780_04720 [Cereibacter azotoformans]|uniref:hypothetical protein n=1 Tax=Cereibacter azotoformans TaxID=43057 RepID=UPI000E35998C|nr:hypothetical protein [Cereibacter azotoformans]AXQ93175.1 hypothetical protein D0Z66_04720 [Cereibacter sphaeroides]UIJ31484.1 hypothetical protein LV780_04720 [Cereibacter azotoformans]